jgi:hypothetical protein
LGEVNLKVVVHEKRWMECGAACFWGSGQARLDGLGTAGVWQKEMCFWRGIKGVDGRQWEEARYIARSGLVTRGLVCLWRCGAKPETQLKRSLRRPGGECVA